MQETRSWSYLGLCCWEGLFSLWLCQLQGTRAFVFVERSVFRPAQALLGGLRHARSPPYAETLATWEKRVFADYVEVSAGLKIIFKNTEASRVNSSTVS